MAKFCGNCGAQLDDTAKVCGKCGTPFGDIAISGVSYVDPEKKAKRKRKFKIGLGVTIAILVLIAALYIVSIVVGYKGAVIKAMSAYKNYDIDTLVSMSSDYYYYIGDADYIEEHLANEVAYALDNYEDQVGHKYKLSYEIIESYELSQHKYQDLMETLSYNEEFDTDIISKVMVVRLELTAQGDGDTVVKTQLELTLTKENGTWKILYMN